MDVVTQQRTESRELTTMDIQLIKKIIQIIVYSRDFFLFQYLCF